MIINDKYLHISEYFDYSIIKDVEKEDFFKKIFTEYKVKTILDCACGTGNDLLLFHSWGYKVVGSDISESMLKIAESKINKKDADIYLEKADFQNLENHFSHKFDIVICSSNAINEHEVDPIKALNSMKLVLNDGGVIVFDQGQTDCVMKRYPAYYVEVNNRDFTCLYKLDYSEKVMTVHAFYFLHTEKENDSRYGKIKIWIRLLNEWKSILKQSGLKASFYGNWSFEPYDIEKSERLIVVAKK